MKLCPGSFSTNHEGTYISASYFEIVTKAVPHAQKTEGMKGCPLNFELDRMNGADEPYSREQVAPGQAFVSLHFRKLSHTQPLVVCNLGERMQSSISKQQTMRQVSHVYGLWTLIARTISGNVNSTHVTLKTIELYNALFLSRQSGHIVVEIRN